jgi:hypothetical protein
VTLQAESNEKHVDSYSREQPILETIAVTGIHSSPYRGTSGERLQEVPFQIAGAGVSGEQAFVSLNSSRQQLLLIL